MICLPAWTIGDCEEQIEAKLKSLHDASTRPASFGPLPAPQEDASVR